MGNIIDPQVVRFANERMRTMSDRLTALKYITDAFAADYADSHIEEHLAANSSDDVVIDSDPLDNRNRVNRASVINSKAAVDIIRTALDTTVGTTGLTVFQIVNAIQVNGSPR